MTNINFDMFWLLRLTSTLDLIIRVFKLYEIDKNIKLIDRIIFRMYISGFDLMYVKHANDNVINKPTFLSNVLNNISFMITIFYYNRI